MTLLRRTLVLCLIVGCKSPSKAGDRCHVDEHGKLFGCESPSSALVCEGIRLQATPCRGPKGCSADPASVACDTTLGQAGDPCDDPGTDTERCGVDSSTLVCGTDHKLEVARACRGPKGCVPGAVACDQSVAEEGDFCGVGWSGEVCSTDGKRILRCDDAKPKGSHAFAGMRFVLAGECKAPQGCRMGNLGGPPAAGETPTPWAVCDYRGVPTGAPCGKGFENRETCGADKSVIIKCSPVSWSFEASIKCKKGETCQPLPGDEKLSNPIVACAAAPTKEP